MIRIMTAEVNGRRSRGRQKMRAMGYIIRDHNFPRGAVEFRDNRGIWVFKSRATEFYLCCCGELRIFFPPRNLPNSPRNLWALDVIQQDIQSLQLKKEQC